MSKFFYCYLLILSYKHLLQRYSATVRLKIWTKSDSKISNKNANRNVNQATSESHASYKVLNDSKRQKADWFFGQLAERPKLVFDVCDNTQYRRFTTSRKHTSHLMINERNTADPNVFIVKCRLQSYMRKLSITSSITNLVPRKCVLFCSCVVGAYLSELAKTFYDDCNVSQTFKEEHLDLCIEPFQKRPFTGNEEISTVVTFLKLDNKNWDILVAQRTVNPLKKIESRFVSFGDSLAYKCPPSIIHFFKAAFWYCLTTLCRPLDNFREELYDAWSQVLEKEGR